MSSIHHSLSVRGFMPSTPTLLLITFSTWTLQLSMKPPLSGRLSSQLSHMPLMSCPYKLYTHKGLILLIWILKIMLLRPVYCQNIGPFNQRWVSRSTAYKYTQYQVPPSPVPWDSQCQLCVLDSSTGSEEFKNSFYSIQAFYFNAAFNDFYGSVLTFLSSILC